jgi:hypothetical protein
MFRMQVHSQGEEGVGGGGGLRKYIISKRRGHEKNILKE